MTAAIATPPINVVVFIASGAIPANTAVKLTAENTVAVTTAITDDVIGFSRTTAADQDRVDIELANGSIVKAVLGGTVAVGNQLMPQAAGAGKVIVAAGATSKSCAIALQAGVANETVSVLTRFIVNAPLNP